MKFLIDLFFYMYKKNIRPITELKNPKTFLIVSNTALGDTILSTPAIKSLKKSFPDSKVVAVLKSTYTPLFKGEGPVYKRILIQRSTIIKMILEKRCDPRAYLKLITAYCEDMVIYINSKQISGHSRLSKKTNLNKSEYFPPLSTDA